MSIERKLFWTVVFLALAIIGVDRVLRQLSVIVVVMPAATVAAPAQRSSIPHLHTFLRSRECFERCCGTNGKTPAVAALVAVGDCRDNFAGGR